MSSLFRSKFTHYIVDSKRFSFRNSPAEAVNKSLGDAGADEGSCSYLYGSCSHGQVFKHVPDRLDASKTDNWDFHSSTGLPYEPEGNGFNRRTGQPSGAVAQARLAGAEIDCQSGISIGNGERIGPRSLGGAGNKSNVCNER